MDQNNGIKITHTTNLLMLNVKSQLTLNCDPNTHIKQILNIETCLIDSQVEPMPNKVLVKGVIGVKVIYIDTDNIFNTLSDTVNFSETLTNEIITSDSQISITNSQFTSTFENDEKFLHISIDGNIECLCNLNTGLNLFNKTENNLITKNSTLSAYCCVQKVNKVAGYDFDFKLDTKINKMLSCDSKIILDDAKCYDGYALISGQIINNIVCEVDNDNSNIKIYTNTTPFKCEIEANGCDNECIADLYSTININSTQITTDIGEHSTGFNFEYSIVVSGYIYKNVNLNVIDDVYSLDSSIELSTQKYSLCKKMPYVKTVETVDTEITLADELNVDEILGMVNTSSNITQRVVKDDMIIVEGVVNGNLLYLDENREIKHLPTQLPFAINLKQELTDDICGIQISAIPSSCKCKVKRGNTLMVDYELCICGSVYTQTQVELIDNLKYGKPFDYGDIAFQIYLARSGESSWELCKRLHISQEQLVQNNKETPTTYAGGEKIIVYR